jgi:chromosome segregation ATPase
MIKNMGVTPGTIEDNRYAMFGLATKTVFTKDEYEALKAKYPNFPSFWKDWEEYVKLLNKGSEISQLATQKDQLQAELTNLDAQINTSVSGSASLTDQAVKLENAITEIDGKTDAISQALKQTFSQQKKQIDSKISQINDRKTQINNQIAQIDKTIADYQTNFANIEAKVNDELKQMGGLNPLKG